MEGIILLILCYFFIKVVWRALGWVCAIISFGATGCMTGVIFLIIIFIILSEIIGAF